MNEHFPTQNEYNPDDDPRTDFDPEFLVLHEAKGPNIHELKAGRFSLPVYFSLAENGRFILAGETERIREGVIVSGLSSGNLAKINHIEVSEELKGVGLGKALLVDLEQNLKDNGIKTIYSTFFTPGTIEFFLRNGYQIVPITSLSKETIQQLALDPSDFEQEVEKENDYKQLKKLPRKVLMKKEI